MRIIVIILAIIQISAQASTSAPLHRFSLGEIKVQTREELSPEAVNANLARLAHYIDAELIPRIPRDISQTMNRYTTQIIFSDDVTSAGHTETTLDQTNGQRLFTISLHTRYLLRPITSYKELIAHEFFHTIHYMYRPHDSSWIKEGLAQLFQYTTTGTHTGVYINMAFLNITTPLIHNISSEQMSNELYGHSALFFYYLSTQCLNNDFYWNYLRQQEQSSLTALEALLSNITSPKKQCESIIAAIVNFQIARVYNKIYLPEPENLRVFYLMSILPQFKPIASIISNQQDLQRALSNLQSFMPLYLEIPNQLDRFIPEDYIVVYFEQSHPFRILNRPYARGNNKVLIIKL